MVLNSNGEKENSELRIRLIAGCKIRVDLEGIFEDFDGWTKEVFEVLAHEGGISTTTDQHRQVVRALRDFYSYNSRAPLNHELRKSTENSLLELERLFPDGIKKGARRLSGLPNPKPAAEKNPNTKDGQLNDLSRQCSHLLSQAC